MKLSTKSRYAVRSMINLADNDGEILSITDISKNQDISERYLELIFARLKKVGLIGSVRGSRGGYRLAKKADEITVFDIINTMEKNASIIKEKCGGDPLKDMLMREIWDPIDNHLESYLKSIKLNSLLK